MILPLPREARLACIEYIFSKKLKTIDMNSFDSTREKLFKKLHNLEAYNNGNDSCDIENQWGSGDILGIHFHSFDQNGVSWEVIVSYYLEDFSENIEQVLAINYNGSDKIIEI